MNVGAMLACSDSPGLDNRIYGVAVVGSSFGLLNWTNSNVVRCGSPLPPSACHQLADRLCCHVLASGLITLQQIFG